MAASSDAGSWPLGPVVSSPGFLYILVILGAVVFYGLLDQILSRFLSSVAIYAERDTWKKRKARMALLVFFHHAIVAIWMTVLVIVDGFGPEGVKLTKARQVEGFQTIFSFYCALWLLDVGMHDPEVDPLRWNKWLHHIGLFIAFPFSVFSTHLAVFEFALFIGWMLQFEGLLCQTLMISHTFGMSPERKIRLFTTLIPIKFLLRVAYCLVPAVRYAPHIQNFGDATLLLMPLAIFLDHTYDDYVFCCLRKRFIGALREKVAAKVDTSASHDDQSVQSVNV